MLTEVCKLFINVINTLSEGIRTTPPIEERLGFGPSLVICIIGSVPINNLIALFAFLKLSIFLASCQSDLPEASSSLRITSSFSSNSTEYTLRYSSCFLIILSHSASTFLRKMIKLLLLVAASFAVISFLSRDCSIMLPCQRIRFNTSDFNLPYNSFLFNSGTLNKLLLVLDNSFNVLNVICSIISCTCVAGILAILNTLVLVASASSISMTPCLA